MSTNDTIIVKNKEIRIMKNGYKRSGSYQRPFETCRNCYQPILKSPLKLIFLCDTKPFALGHRIGLDPQRHNFALGIPTYWYLKMLKFVIPPTRMLKFALPPTPTPNASRWNIGGIRSPTRGAGVGHVDFMLFVSCLLALDSQCKRCFQWNMGFSIGQRCLYEAQSAKVWPTPSPSVTHPKVDHRKLHSPQGHSPEVILHPDLIV